MPIAASGEIQPDGTWVFSPRYPVWAQEAKGAQAGRLHEIIRV
jgi:hypothetical protein